MRQVEKIYQGNPWSLSGKDARVKGGYSAGYYSYMWSEVLDKDAFNAFLETSLFDQATALSFRQNILEKGGSMDEMEMYLNFRGKELVAN